jgi:hypothetical protein
VRRRRSKITAAAGLVVGGGGDQRSQRQRGFLSAAAKDHVDIDLGDVCVGDVELDDVLA